MTKINTTPPQLTEQDIKRFWKNVDLSPGQGPEGTCWGFRRIKKSTGYGVFTIKCFRSCKAHRIAYLIATGEWPSILVCHTCDWRPCCRPEHLFKGTAQDNLVDAYAKGRRPKTIYIPPERVPRGSRNGSAKLTEDDVIMIRAHAGVYTATEIARRFGVDPSTISVILRRKFWIHI